MDGMPRPQKAVARGPPCYPAGNKRRGGTHADAHARRRVFCARGCWHSRPVLSPRSHRPTTIRRGRCASSSGSAPGSTADYAARTVAQKLSLKYGQQFVVESRAGAGSNLAAEYVARAPKDGYTLLMGTVANTINATRSRSSASTSPRISRRWRWSPRCRTSWWRIPRPAFRTVADLVAAAKAKPEPDDVRLLRRRQRAARLRRAAQYRRRHQAHARALSRQRAVAHRPAGRAHLGDVLAGADGAAAHPVRRADRDRGDAPPACCPICRAWRMPATRDFDAGLWFGMLAPAGTPREIVDKVSVGINEALKMDDVIQALAQARVRDARRHAGRILRATSRARSRNGRVSRSWRG